MIKQISLIALAIGIGAILFPATHVAADYGAARHQIIGKVPYLAQELSKVRQVISGILPLTGTGGQGGYKAGGGLGAASPAPQLQVARYR